MSIRYFYKQKMTRFVLRLILVILTFPVFFRGGTTATAMTLEQAIRSAVQNNKDLQAAQYVVKIARARLMQAGLLPNPRLSFSGYDAIFTNEPDEYELGAGFTQKFPVAGRIARQKDVARMDVARAQEEIRNAKLKLSAQVAQIFYRILILNRQIFLRDQLMQVDRELLDASRNRFRAAEVSELDVNTAQLELEQLYQERTLLKVQRSRSSIRLKQLLGQTFDKPLQLDKTLPPIPMLPDLEEEQRRALKLRPDLRSAQLSVERSSAQVGLAKAQRWEDWTAGLGVFSGQTVFPNGLSTGIDVGPSFVLTIPLPLWNRNQGRIAEAVALNQQSSARVRALTLRIRNEVAKAFFETKRLQDTVDRYRNGLLKLSDRNMLLAQQAYMMGQTSILTAVQAQRQHGDQHIAYLNALGQYLKSWVALHRAVGDYLEFLGRSGNHGFRSGERIHE
ncbi:hypothetical protein BOX24_04770 [Leptospirillum ferriphilum]|jgi:cobalt-zinc-cadmium efflux system outer membrane protein|uniref:TolC family protein n=3 Tax=Leptospirillum ferriphilum TaxID=178606 RepID=A0A1V3SXW6_9BACT|nr:chemiosmotic efflux system C protein C [Leptospirillum ferriphilum ML-04]OOH73374.1 hypothetical protein BOX24_04770 [Leptospirillum ferriphilum]